MRKIRFSGLDWTIREFIPIAVMFTLISIGILFLLFHISKPRPVVEKTATFKALYYHSSDHYSIARLRDNEIVIEQIPWYASPKLFADVPPDKEMWFHYKIGQPQIENYCHIHIHSIDDIKGAGWKTKHSSGTIERIQ